MKKFDLKLYRGYLNEHELIVFGHVFQSWAPDKYRLDRRGVKHAFSILHMFRIKPLENVEVELQFQQRTVKTKTQEDGYFRFTIPFDASLKSGWHSYQVTCKLGEFGIVEKEEVLKPFESEYGIITDIDDTFLVSHTNNIFRKLYVLLSKNLDKRKIFDDVAQHYRHLSKTGQESDEASNSFFYVSSSEWNLYNFIDAFITKHNLPKGIIKLKKIKTGISDFLFTGRGGHDHKFIKIKDIISFYPNLRYILIGDDSQRDPFLYERICKTFPENIKAIYIRQTHSSKKQKVLKVLKNIESMSVETCYFNHNSQAIEHSKKIGIL